MKALFRFSVLALLLNSIPLGYAVEPATAVNCNEALEINPFLYQIEKDGKTSFVLGTMHIGVSLQDFPDYTKEIIKNSRKIVYEIPQRGSIFYKIYSFYVSLRGTINFGGPKLSEQLSPEAWRRITQKLSDSIPEEMLDRMKPFFVSMVYQDPTMASKDKRAKLEGEIDAYAKSCGIGAGSLETIWMQMKLISSICDVKGLEEQVMRSAPEKPASITEQTYRMGDADKFNQTIEELKEENPSLLQSFLLDRNRNWIPQIERHHRRRTTLFAVGALHLMGEEGVLNLLSLQGYTITRINTPDLAAKALEQLQR